MLLAEQDIEEALAWADVLGSDLGVATAKCQIVLALAETDPHRAADMLSESGIAGRDFDVVVVQVLQRWVAKSPPEAAAWVSTFHGGSAREAGIKVVADYWLPSEPSAALGWLDSLKDTLIRAEAARSMMGVILLQPEDIRSDWLENADPVILNDLEKQREEAIKEMGDNMHSFAH